MVAVKIAIRDAIVAVPISDFVQKLTEDPVKIKEFLRRVMGPERRTLIGDEREHMLTVFKLIEPISSSNNQRSFTDVYEHAGKQYHVHYFYDDIDVEEIISNDI